MLRLRMRNILKKYIKRKKVITMNPSGLTVAQATDRLIQTRSRRQAIVEDIETLRSCERHMQTIHHDLNRKSASFKVESQLDTAWWRGRTSRSCHQIQNRIGTSTRPHLSLINDVIRRVNQMMTTLNQELTSLDIAIRDLEQITNGGF